MSRLATLKGQFNEVKSAIEKIERAATDAGRDLNDDEQADVNALYERAAALKPQIESEDEKAGNLAAISEILAKHNDQPVRRAASVAADGPDISAGEFLSNALKVQAGLMASDEHVERAAKYLRASQITTDTAGIVPTPVVGNLISLYDSARPVFNSFTSRPMPEKGKTFTRPEITQHVATGDQATEATAVSSQKMTITGNTVTKFTEAGYLDLSQQDVDWTDPAAMELVIQDFARVYAKRMETRASTYLEAQVTGLSGTAYSIASVSAAVDTYMAGFEAVRTNAEEPADTVWVDAASHYALASLTNSDGVSALTILKQALNDAGVGPVSWVVGHQLTAATRIVGSSRLIESYEQTNGLLRVAQPDVLGQRVAYSGYGAFHCTPEGFVVLSDV
jgi:HK97 family phage major capsid protein